jgi:hypothetical protein
MTATTAVLEALTVELVRQAPELDRAVLERGARTALLAAVEGQGELVRLALVIERVIDDLAEGEIALGVGLPALAMAAYTRHAATAAGAAHDPLAVRAAIYELETMTPVPLAPPARRIDGAAKARSDRAASIVGTDRVDDLRKRYAR